MKRREFITLLGSVAAAWPLAARAQQGERMRRIGVLMRWPRTHSGTGPVRGIPAGAAAIGLGSRAQRADRHALDRGRGRRIRKYAAELVALAPDVILAGGAPPVAALQQATRTVPIVFVIVADPVGAGFVDSLARPGGNATGFINFEYGMGGKWLELLKQIAPDVTRAAIIRDPAITPGIGQFGAIQAVAPSFGIEVSPVNVRDADEIERASRPSRAPPMAG